MGVCSNFLLALLIVLGAMALFLHVYYDGLDTALLQLIPLVPSNWFQNAGVPVGMFVFNQVIPTLRSLGVLAPALKCRQSGDEKDIWVIVSTNKGGSILSARFTVEVAFACGVTVTMGDRVSDAWPPVADTLPTTRADIMVAIPHVPQWPEFAFKAKGQVRCVVVPRDPFGKFRSLFTYAYDGGESGLRQISVKLHELGNRWNESVALLYDEMGKETLEVLHGDLIKSLAIPQCTKVTFESLTTDYDKAATRWLEAWSVDPAVIPTLLLRVGRHDVRKQSAELVARDAHLTSYKWTKTAKDEIERAIWAHSELAGLIKKQRKDLGY